MITRSPDTDADNAQATATQSDRKFLPGQIAEQPWPDQAARAYMSHQATSHQSKKMRNRDFDAVPLGSLATD